MDKIDKLIAEALAEEERAGGADTSEQPFVAQAFGLFRGRNAWIWVVTTLSQILLFFAGVWMAWQFFQTTDVILALRWGLSAAVLILASLALKLSLMPVIEANRVIRELRRIELMRHAIAKDQTSH